jgi:Tfp pilus assembly protein PilF/4-amino-4-deoxy-L-arabinose transferase-like glycosyltransferase
LALVKSLRKKISETARPPQRKVTQEHTSATYDDSTASGTYSERVWFTVVFLVALLLRLIHLFQIESIPLFYHLAGDGRTYDEWAQGIAAGEWIGKGVFYQAPLYPYFLGVLQLIFGHDLWLIRVFQIVLGALSCALIFLAGRRLFSRAAGIAAGLILAGYAPAIFFDALIEKSVLDLFILSLLLLVLVRCMDKPHWTLCLAVGVILGFLGLSRENALILAVVLPPWILLHFSQSSVATRLSWVGLFCAGLFLVLLPVGVRNYAVGGEFKLTTSQFGPNFFIGNNPSADGTYGSIRKQIGEVQLEGTDARRLAERETARHLSPGEVSAHWMQKSLDFIRAEPGRWLALLGKKWLMVWNAREVEDSDDLYIYREWSWVLALLSRLNHFGIVAPLAIAGIWLSRAQWRRLWLLYACIFVFAFSVAIFYVFGRYRYPLTPLLALFAGAAIAHLVALLRHRAWRSVTVSAGLLLAVAAFVNWPIYAYDGAGAVGYNNLSNAYYKQGRAKEATAMALKAIELEPDHCAVQYNLGNLYAGQGDLDSAGQSFREALRLCPNYSEAHANYGQLIAEQGDIEAGLAYFRRAIALNPSIGRAYLNLGVGLAKLGRLDEAIPPLQNAVKLAGNSPEPSYYLGSVYAAKNRYTEAAEYFDLALQINADFAPAHQSLGDLLVLQGKKYEALGHYQEARRLMNQRRVR